MDAVKLIRLDQAPARTACDRRCVTCEDCHRPALRQGGLVIFRRPLDHFEWLGRVVCILEPDNAMPLVLVMSRHTDGFPHRPLLTPADRVTPVRGEMGHAFRDGDSVYKVAEAIAGKRLVVRKLLDRHPCLLTRPQVDCVGCRWPGGNDDPLHAADLCYRVEYPPFSEVDACPEHWLAAWVESQVAAA